MSLGSIVLRKSLHPQTDETRAGEVGPGEGVGEVPGVHAVGDQQFAGAAEVGVGRRVVGEDVRVAVRLRAVVDRAQLAPRPGRAGADADGDLGPDRVLLEDHDPPAVGHGRDAVDAGDASRHRRCVGQALDPLSAVPEAPGAEVGELLRPHARHDRLLHPRVFAHAEGVDVAVGIRPARGLRVRDEARAELVRPDLALGRVMERGLDLLLALEGRAAVPGDCNHRHAEVDRPEAVGIGPQMVGEDVNVLAEREAVEEPEVIARHGVGGGGDEGGARIAPAVVAHVDERGMAGIRLGSVEVEHRVVDELVARQAAAVLPDAADDGIAEGEERARMGVDSRRFDAADGEGDAAVGRVPAVVAIEQGDPTGLAHDADAVGLGAGGGGDGKGGEHVQARRHQAQSRRGETNKDGSRHERAPSSSMYRGRGWAVSGNEQRFVFGFAGVRVWR